MTETTDNYRAIFLSAAPMIDVRAPLEFSRGTFPHAINLPLMNDLERQKVGTCYKQQGQQAAINLGHRLVSGVIKAQRIAAWADFVKQHPDAYLYCFRGGLRSKLSQQWLKEDAGISITRVAGGYKVMRSFLLETLEQSIAQSQFRIIGGMTGTGKTDVLMQMANGINLEAHAHHRGSSFGKHATAQPSQIDFENRLAIDFLKKRNTGQNNFVIEDEGRAIGSCSVPLSLYQGMQQYPLIWLEDTLENRVERILRDYVIRLLEEFVVIHGEIQGFALFAERLRKNLGNIVKRLGGERYQRIAALMDAALMLQQQNNCVDLHRDWIESLLNEYYDPMYHYQRKKKNSRIVFSGNPKAVLDYLQQC